MIASIAFAFYAGNNPIIDQVGYAAASFLFGFGLFLVTLVIPAIYWPMHRFLERWIKFKLVEGFLLVAEAIHGNAKPPILIVKIILLSASMHFSTIMLFAVLGRDVDATLPITSYVLTVPLILVAAGLPITIGGLGVREATAITLFAAAGKVRPDAAAVAILFIPALLAASLPGLIFSLGRRKPIDT